jgi:adenosylmethionine-8-amino-7-oxononanoate aminotransferase
MSQATTQFDPQLLKPEGVWDRSFSYHPFDVEIVKAVGAKLYDATGREFYDASGGPMAVNLGHNNERMKAAIHKQLDQFAFAHPVLANRVRAELCEAIASITPGDLNTTFLVSGGSEAVETSLKLARQYHYARGKVGKHKFISNYESYHGMTLATMSLSGNPGTNRYFDPMLHKWPKAHQYSDFRRPDDMSRDDWAQCYVDELERTIHYEGPETIAAYIATPHGCGSEYGLVPPTSYWQGIRKLCDEYDLLFIADEVVTGFGRTGKWFGMQHFDVIPDMMTVAKGMSGCYMPLGGVIVTDKVRAPFDDGAYFVHGFTHGGHPLAATAGLETIKILKEDGLQAQAEKNGRHLFSHAKRLRAHPTVADIRGWGMFMVMELVENRETRAYFTMEKGAEQLFQATAMKNGLVFYSTLYGPQRRPLFNRGLPMWVSPPFCISETEIDDLVDKLDTTLSEWEHKLGLS